MSLTAFVSGASGFVGSHLVRELHEQGWEIHILVRPSASLEEIEDIPVLVHHGDITDLNSITSAIPDRADAVFHVAASTNFWSRNNPEQDRVNIGGTQHMLEASRTAQAGRFIYTSSFTTWGFRNMELTEQSERTDATDWINYVRSKYLAEQAVLKAAEGGHINGVVLNPAHILGPGDKNNWSRMIRMVNEGKMFACPPGSGNFCDVREIAKAHIAAFHHGRNGEKYLLGGEYAAFCEVVKLTGEVLGKRVPNRPAPAWMIKTWGKVKSMTSAITGREPDITPESAAMILFHVACNSEKAQTELGYQFTPIRNLIEDTVVWMKHKGLLS